MTILCRCKNVSVEDVVNAIKDGANTIEAVSQKTGAGTACGRCKSLIETEIEKNK